MSKLVNSDSGSVPSHLQSLYTESCASLSENDHGRVAHLAKARPKKTPQAAMGTVQVGAAMERIAVDLMGPLNEIEWRNRYILVVQDYFRKWVEAYPVPNEQAATVAEKIASECWPGGALQCHSTENIGHHC